MRNKSRIYLILIILVIANVSTLSFTVYLSNNDGTIEIRTKNNLKSPRSSGYWTRNFIHVDGNWSDTATTYAWCRGDGSWGNPYIIENVTIDASTSPTGSGIFIYNSTNDYFVIRNCTIFNAVSGIFDGGIKLEYTNNGSLSNNNCSNNYGDGILLYNYCANNTISGNIANDNNDHGILLRDNCFNNTISGNLANDNSVAYRLLNDCVNNTISGNNGTNGINLYSSSNDNTISENTMNSNDGHGLSLNVNCDNNDISGNTILNTEIFGIYLWESSNNTILGNTVINGDNNGIYVSSNSDDNTISGNIANNHRNSGIELDDCRNNTIVENTANNNDNGIVIVGNNNTILGNAVNENQYRGIVLWQSDGNYILGNIANNNSFYGIHLFDNCDNNTLSGNIAINNSDFGIYLESNCNNNIIAGNNASNIDPGQQDRGIYLYNRCDFNTITENIANNNLQFGIQLSNLCINNTISENTASNNLQVGIRLNNQCENSTILGNIVHYNIQYGIYMLCDNNRLYLNNFIGNGIHARDEANNQWDNGIIGNYWDNYTGVDANDDGIGDTPYDVPPVGGSVDNYPVYDDGPHTIIINSPKPGVGFDLTAPNFNVSINFPILDTVWYTLDNGLTNYTFIGSFGTINQTAWDSVGEGAVSIKFYVNNTAGNINSAEVTVFKDTIAPIIQINLPINNSIFRETPPVYYISIEEVHLNRTWYTIDGGITNTTFTELTGAVNKTLWDALLNGYVTIRFYTSDVAGHIGYSDLNIIKDIPYYRLYLEMVDQSFSKDKINITFFVFNETRQGIFSAAIQMWWNGTDVSSNVINLGNGFYYASLDTLTVASGEDPILLNMTISASGYEDKYFETFITIEPPEIAKLLQVEITEHSYSLEYFNLTLFAYDEAEQGIDSATVQIWWNGVDVSADVINLGNGFFSISLDPITVAPGEDPILLTMIISADGYQDKSFETYIAVDPDTLDKGIPAEEFPFTTIIIAVSSIAGGIGVAGVASVLLRKRKRASENK